MRVPTLDFHIHSKNYELLRWTDKPKALPLLYAGARYKGELEDEVGGIP